MTANTKLGTCLRLLRADPFDTRMNAIASALEELDERTRGAHSPPPSREGEAVPGDERDEFHRTAFHREHGLCSAGHVARGPAVGFDCRYCLVALVAMERHRAEAAEERAAEWQGIAEGHEETIRGQAERFRVAEQREKEARATAEQWRNEANDNADQAERVRQERETFRRERDETRARVAKLDAELEAARARVGVLHEAIIRALNVMAPNDLAGARLQDALDATVFVREDEEGPDEQRKDPLQAKEAMVASVPAAAETEPGVLRPPVQGAGEVAPPGLTPEAEEATKWDAKARAREDSRRAGPVSHDEARRIAQGYIDKAFGNKEDPKTRITHSIPADYRRDSDLRLHAYIDQQEEREEGAKAAKAEGGKVARQALEILDRATVQYEGDRNASPNPWAALNAAREQIEALAAELEGAK